VINFTLEATAQSITHRRLHHTPAPFPPPPRQNSTTAIDAPQSSSELLSLDWTASISFCNEFLLSELLYPIPHSKTPSSALLSPGWELFTSHRHSYNAFHIPYSTPFHRSTSGISTPQSHQCSAAWIGSPPCHSTILNPTSFGAPQYYPALLHPPFLALLNFILHCLTPPLSALLNFIPHCLTPRLSALVSLNLTLFFFIPRFSNTFCGTHLFHRTLPIWHSSLPLVVVPIFHLNVSYCLSYPHLGSQLANISLHLW